MIIHVLSNPLSVVRFVGNRNDIVIVNSKFIGQSFERKHRISPIIASRYRAFFIYLYFILKSKLSKEIRFHIYHEGNNYFFDLLWLLLSPVVYRTEYYGTDAFREITDGHIKGSVYYRIITLLKLQNHFEYFRSFDDIGRPDTIWFRVKDDFVKQSFKPREIATPKRATVSKSAIILIGKDIVSDILLCKIIDNIIERLADLGFFIAVKNHPNPAFQLSYKIQNVRRGEVIYLNPLNPAEDYADEYRFALGFGSTGILSFENSVSLYYLLPKSVEVDERIKEQKKERIQHLENVAKNFKTCVAFPASIEDLKKNLCD